MKFFGVFINFRNVKRFLNKVWRYGFIEEVFCDQALGSMFESPMPIEKQDTIVHISGTQCWGGNRQLLEIIGHKPSWINKVQVQCETLSQKIRLCRYVSWGWAPQFCGLTGCGFLSWSLYVVKSFCVELWKLTLICGYKDRHLECSKELCWFSKVAFVGFSEDPWLHQSWVVVCNSSTRNNFPIEWVLWSVRELLFTSKVYMPLFHPYGYFVKLVI